jgi:uncharacterized protein YbcI
VLVLANAMTRTERTLVESGMVDVAHRTRRRIQEALRPELVTAVEAITARRVVAFLTDCHFDPDLLRELFILDGTPSEEPIGA